MWESDKRFIKLKKAPVDNSWEPQEVKRRDQRREELTCAIECLCVDAALTQVSVLGSDV